MNNIPFHEIANIFPLIRGDEFVELKADIKANGVHEPIVMYQGKILDGRNRFRASQEVGAQPKFIEYEGSDPVSYVLSLNLHRRHMDSGQRAAMAVDVLPMLEAEAKKRQGSRNDLEADIPQKIAESNKEQFEARQQVAEKFNTNRQYVSDAKKLKEEEPELFEDVRTGEKTLQEAKKTVKQKKLEQKKTELINDTAADISDNRPELYHKPYDEMLSTIAPKSIDLLITDPPYSTDIDDIGEFVSHWLPQALEAVKDDGRAYICIGAYPKELAAYLNKLAEQDRFIVDNPLIWTYRNTLGITPKDKYNLNYQVILHLYTKDSPELDTSITNEMFSVQDINAPDGRQGDRYHTWQKPDELAHRLIRHSTKTGDTVLDLFACTGTFPIAASKLGRNSLGCDISAENLEIAKSRGCNVIY